VIHTVHLPPEPEAAEAVREGQGASDPAIVVGVSVAQARAWAPLVTFDCVIRNGAPVSLIPWSDQPGDGLIFAGRLSAEKGAAVAIEIAQLAGERIELYGAAYDEAYARDLRRHHDGDPGVIFREPLPRADLWRRLASARAVLCPSDWDEPFGLVAAEAQAAGTPVVAFARGGLTEIVDDTVTGYLVEPGNVAEAVAAVRSVASMDRRRCRQHAVDHLDIEACLSGYEALYASVGRRPAPAGRLVSDA
jgi:glycosyltransferase involved in cell wall biosynthesis